MSYHILYTFLCFGTWIFKLAVLFGTCGGAQVSVCVCVWATPSCMTQLKFDFSSWFLLHSSTLVCFQLPNGNNWHNWHILQKLNKNPMRNNAAGATTTAAAMTTQRRSKRRRRNNGACHKCCCCCCKKKTNWQKKTIEDRRLRITIEKWKNLSANNTQRTAVVLQRQRLVQGGGGGDVIINISQGSDASAATPWQRILTDAAAWRRRVM